MTEALSNIYALLIGIDYYQPNQLYRSLKGAVRDINLVENFLMGMQKIPAERIRKLISPNPAENSLLAVRSAQTLEPTYANIVKAFDELTALAQPGEQIYIHYSGHGGRVKTLYPNLKQGTGDQFDEGLVPMDIGDSPAGRYLRDVEFTTLLKRMTDKGLVVTVVLDSCHSGGATRGGLDAEIRSSTEPDLLLRNSESLVADQAELEKNWLELTQRAGVGVAGLPQAREYVLLAACRDNEEAYEYPANGGTERNGALTYWMIDTLTSAATKGQPLSYKLLHDRINAQIQSKFQKQTPMILGESDRLVFGTSNWTTAFTVNVIKVDPQSTQIMLNAGQAQGLSKGTRFAIYPLNTTDFINQQNVVAVVEISKPPGATESTARVLSPEEGGIALKEKLEPGAPAIMISAPVDLVQRVRFFTEKIEGDKENDLPAELVSRQQEALTKVQQALAANGWVKEVKEGESAMFQVAIDRDGQYEICRNGRPIENLRPLLSIDQPSAPQQVVERLVHLTKYLAVQSLDNSSSNLAEMIEVNLLQEDGTAFADAQMPSIQDGEIITLELVNKGEQMLKVAVLDLDPTWAISQIPVGGLESPFYNLAANAKQRVKLGLSIPDDHAYDQTKEILKVFAIQKGLADFRWLTLPSLDQPLPAQEASLEAEEQGMVTRSMDGESNPLNSLMKMIGADLANTPPVTRAATLVVDPAQEWVTKQVQISVKR